jgi:hypothetical protein
MLCRFWNRIQGSKHPQRLSPNHSSLITEVILLALSIYLYCINKETATTLLFFVQLPPSSFTRRNFCSQSTMRLMDVFYTIYIHLKNDGTIKFKITMPDDVTFNVIFIPISDSRPRIFSFQASSHVGIQPLVSITYRYIQLGGVQQECSGGDAVKNVLKIIRQAKFQYSRFANKDVIIPLVVRGTLTESFLEVFNWVSSPFFHPHTS